MLDKLTGPAFGLQRYYVNNFSLMVNGLSWIELSTRWALKRYLEQ